MGRNQSLISRGNQTQEARPDDILKFAELGLSKPAERWQARLNLTEWRDSDACFFRTILDEVLWWGREAKCIHLPTMLIQHKKEDMIIPPWSWTPSPPPPQPMNTQHLGYSSPLYNKAESCLHIAYAILLYTLNSIRLLMMPNTMLLHSTA